MKLFEQTYTADTLGDWDLDITDAFNEDLNPAAKELTVDEDGLVNGTFTITITWQPYHDVDGYAPTDDQ